MTTITIERALLEQAHDLIPYLEALNRSTQQQKEVLVNAVRAALAAPATAPEPFAYTTGMYGGRFTLEPVNPAVTIPKGFLLYLHPPATAPEPLFAELIAQHEGLAEELAAMDATATAPEQPVKLDPTGSELHSKQANQAEVTPTGQVSAPEQGPCKWTFDDDESNTWASGCGELWSFIDGGPTENRVKYCHGCGKPVVLGDKQ